MLRGGVFLAGAIALHVLILTGPVSKKLFDRGQPTKWLEPPALLFNVEENSSAVPQYSVRFSNKKTSKNSERIDLRNQELYQSVPQRLSLDEIVQSGNVLPSYPPLAIERGLEGVVELKLLLSPTGKVIESTILKSSGHDLLDQAAQRASLLWRFQNYRANQKLLAPVKFTIDS